MLISELVIRQIDKCFPKSFDTIGSNGISFVNFSFLCKIIIIRAVSKHFGTYSTRAQQLYTIIHLKPREKFHRFWELFFFVLMFVIISYVTSKGVMCDQNLHITFMQRRRINIRLKVVWLKCI